jgi:hypothetical protein
MIERTPAFKVGEHSFLSLEEAQKYELKQLLPPKGIDQVVDWVITNKAKIVDILTTTTTSKAKARKIHGGSKPRKNKSIAISPTPASPASADNVLNAVNDALDVNT